MITKYIQRWEKNLSE